MNFQCQTEPLAQLKLLAEHKQHGVLITGGPGYGKTYLAQQYAKMLEIPDFYIINPVISDLKIMIESCVESQTLVVICIEDLDSGVIQAAYPLLKLIEDCPSYIYVVVTCNNLAAIPDTIPSRCALVTVNPPTKSDLIQYARSVDPKAFDFVSKHKVWRCAKGFTEVAAILKFNAEQLKYFNTLPAVIQSRSSVSNIAWKLQHYEDNSETPIILVVRYLLFILNGHHKQACLACLNDLSENRMSKNAIISKLVFELTYT